MTNLLITGETGCGKTYKTINDYCKNDKFAYIAPCRQLVYESFIEYSKENDSLNTGECKIKGQNNNYSVYESLKPEQLKHYDTLIIDEAHFLTDDDRGYHLNTLLSEAINLNKNVYLLTATNNISNKELKRLNFTNINLNEEFKVPVKKKISFNKAYDNIKEGLKTIVFFPTIDGCYDEMYYIKNEYNTNVAVIHSSIYPNERLRTQYLFKKGEIQVVVCTNVLAQGVNFPCENLIIYDDYFNTDELLQQKLGRLGRPFYSKLDEVYYATDEFISRRFSKKPIKKEKPDKEMKDFFVELPSGKYEDNKNYLIIDEDERIVDCSFALHELKDVVDCNYDIFKDYEEIKYSKAFIHFIKNISEIYNLTIFEKHIENAMNVYEDINNKMIKTINYLKKHRKVIRL